MRIQINTILTLVQYGNEPTDGRDGRVIDSERKKLSIIVLTIAK